MKKEIKLDIENIKNLYARANFIQKEINALEDYLDINLKVVDNNHFEVVKRK